MEPTPDTQVVTATQKCPFCAEQILAEAKKCRYCGEFVDGHPPKRDFDKDKARRILAVVGSFLLVIAPFAPIVSAPIFGRITLFQQGKGDGVILLAAAFVALGFAAFKRYGFLWASGIIGLIDVGNLFYVFWFKLPDMIEQYRKSTAGNAFSSLGEITLGNIEPDWGAAVLLIGTALSLTVVISLGFRKTVVSLGGKLAMAAFGLAILYQVLLYFFPYLKYWPTLLGL